MAKNEYSNMTDLIRDYYDTPVGEYLNQSVTINNVTLACDIYRVANESVLTSAVFTGCTEVDANTQIIIGRDLSVASGTTLIPPYRCKGIFIGDIGTFTNAGTISMTARGAIGAGKNIQLTPDYMISAIGGSANSSPAQGVLSCGGGGDGGAYSTYPKGVGGTGTSFSGGAGGGGNGYSGTTAPGSGSSTGGAGGNGHAADVRSAGYPSAAGGGAGNPGGSSNAYSPTSGGGSGSATNGSTGTGGLIVILASNIVSTGSFTSAGSNGGNAYANSGQTVQSGSGGGSGGGCIVLLSREKNITGTYSVAGGSAGASNGSSGHNGGSGTYASYIVADIVLQNLPVEFAITDSDHIDNLDPSDAVRFTGLIDEDELYYDIMGTRHKVSGTREEIQAKRDDFNISDGTTTLTQRDVIEIASPLTVEDDNTEGNEKTVIGADTSGSFDFTQIHAPGTAGQVEGHIYSTDETVVGKWIDGRDLYEKTVSCGALPNATLKEVPSGLTDEKVIDIRGYAFNPVGVTFNLPHVDISNVVNGVCVYYRASTHMITLQTGTNRTSLSESYVTLRYTKTTDTASS